MTTDDALLVDIGDDTGALVVYADADLTGQEIEIQRSGPAGGHVHLVHNVVRPRRVGSSVIHAAVFPDLAAGAYLPCDPALVDHGVVIVAGGRVTEVDWR